MPLNSQIHVNKQLSNISVKYKNDMFVHDKVFPVLPVMKDSDLYRVYTRDFRLPETSRADGALAREASFDITNNSYQLEVHALKDYIPDAQARNYDIGSLKADVTEELTRRIMIREEKRMADLFTTTSWSLNVSLAAANAWNADTTVSNPIPIVDTAATTVIQNSGFMPNFGVLRREAAIAAKNHVSVLDRIKYTDANMTIDKLKGLFDLPELLVPHAVYDTSAQGQTEAITNLWGDIMFVGYKPPRPSPLAPSSGYMFKHNQPMVRTWRDEERKSDAVEVEVRSQPKVVASLSGYLIKDVI